MTESKSKILERSFKGLALSLEAQPAEVCAALTILLYDVATVTAILSKSDPSTKLAELIAVIEEGFGKYLQNPSIVMALRLGETLFSAKPKS